MATFWTGLWHLVLPSNALEFWTLALTLATGALTYVAFRGLHSLGLTKTDIKTRAQRDAKACAIERCREFADVVVPRNSAIRDNLNAAKISAFLKSPTDLRLEPDAVKLLPAAHTWIKALPENVHRDALFALNALEAWAMYFTSGVADHELAEPPCARLFCSIVAQNYAFLLVAREEAAGGSGRFPNIVKLFNSWREGKDGQAFLASIMQELARLMPPKKDKLPKVIGTDIDE